ncbi:hypothetical protein GCM10022245_20930 [Streptomyces mayteni]
MSEQRVGPLEPPDRRVPARIDANAASGAPSPSDMIVWLCRSAWTSRVPVESRDVRAAPGAVLGAAAPAVRVAPDTAVTSNPPAAASVASRLGPAVASCPLMVTE